MLDTRTRELIGIAASVVAKCQPCLDYHVEEARKAGVSESDIRHAVGVARMVRKAGEENMDKYADTVLGQSEPPSVGACCSDEKCCG